MQPLRACNAMWRDSRYMRRDTFEVMILPRAQPPSQYRDELARSGIDAMSACDNLVFLMSGKLICA